MTGRRTRRRFLATVGGAGAAAPAAGRRSSDGRDATAPTTRASRTGPGGRPPETWRMFAADAANVGWPGKGDGPETLAERWRFATGDWVQSSPAVVDGTVYFGSDDGSVYAVDAATGDRRWAFDTGESQRGVSSSPAVVGGTLYVGAGDGTVYALAADGGTELWRADLGSWVFAPPTVAGGTVYVGAYDGSMYALDADDGAEKWRYRTGNRVMEAAAVADGTVYVGSHDQSVYALDATTGVVQWTFETEGVVNTAPTVAGDAVYAGSKDGRVYALAAADGTERWRFDTGRTVSPASPAVFRGILFTGNATTYALSAEDGEVVWRDRQRITGPPAVLDGAVYVPGPDGVRVLDRRLGEQVGAGPTEDLVWTGAVVADGTVYVGDRANNLYAFGPAGGEATATPTATDAGTTTPRTTFPPERTETAPPTGTAPDDTATPLAPPTTAGSTDWLAGWRSLLAWLAAVLVGGPLVLGALAALAGRGDADAAGRGGDDGEAE